MPSFSPVPGCSGSNDGYNVCVDPSLVGDDRIGEIDGIDRSITGEALDLCQGQCINDSQCKGRLVCVESEGDGNGIFKVRGCNKNAQQNWKYCAYPAFRNVIPVDDEKNLLANVKKSFMRVENDGTLSVYDEVTNTRLWNNEDVGGTESDPSFRHSVDFSISTAKDLTFAGEYRRTGVYYQFQEELERSGFHVDGTEIQVHGSTSKAYQLAAPYQVNARSTLSLQFTIGTGVKALAICPDDGLNPRVEGNGRVVTSCLLLGCKAIEAFDDIFDINYVKVVADDKCDDGSASVPLSSVFPSVKKLKYFGLIQIMNENLAEISNSVIMNLNIEDEEEVSDDRRRTTITPDPLKCGPGELVVTTKPGLYHVKESINDFCTPAGNVLKMITKNEGDACSSDGECRSGKCVGDICVSEVSKIAITLSRLPYHIEITKNVFTITENARNRKEISIPTVGMAK